MSIPCLYHMAFVHNYFFICDITHFMFVMYNICAHHIFYMTRRSCTVHALLSQLSYNDCWWWWLIAAGSGRENVMGEAKLTKLMTRDLRYIVFCFFFATSTCAERRGLLGVLSTQAGIMGVWSTRADITFCCDPEGHLSEYGEDRQRICFRGRSIVSHRQEFYFLCAVILLVVLAFLNFFASSFCLIDGLFLFFYVPWFY